MGIVWGAVVKDHRDICQSNDLGQKRMDLFIALTDAGRVHIVSTSENTLTNTPYVDLWVACGHKHQVNRETVVDGDLKEPTPAHLVGHDSLSDEGLTLFDQLVTIVFSLDSGLQLLVGVSSFSVQ